MKNNSNYVFAAVPLKEVLSIFEWRSAPLGSCLEITHNDIPRDATCVDVHYNYETRCFDFLLSHESFNKVPLGCCIPYIGGDVCSVIKKTEAKKGGNDGQE